MVPLYGILVAIAVPFTYIMQRVWVEGGVVVIFHAMLSIPFVTTLVLQLYAPARVENDARHVYVGVTLNTNAVGVIVDEDEVDVVEVDEVDDVEEVELEVVVVTVLDVVVVVVVLVNVTTTLDDIPA